MCMCIRGVREQLNNTLNFFQPMVNENMMQLFPHQIFNPLPTNSQIINCPQPVMPANLSKFTCSFPQRQWRMLLIWLYRLTSLPTKYSQTILLLILITIFIYHVTLNSFLITQYIKLPQWRTAWTVIIKYHLKMFLDVWRPEWNAAT